MAGILKGSVSFHSLIDRMKVEVNRAARKVSAPEGDIQPQLYLYRPAHKSLHVLDLPWSAFSSRERKDWLAQVIVPRLIELGEVGLVGLQFTAYVSRLPIKRLTPAEQQSIFDRSTLPDRIPMPSRDPERIECIEIVAFDAEIREQWERQIIRSAGRRPSYGPWHKAEAMPWGLMLDPIAEALR